MALVAWPGTGIVWPYFDDAISTPQFTTSTTINATGEKLAVVGRVRWSDHGTHDIRGVGWRAGAIVSAGGSGIITSLQDVDATTGNPSRPDGTQDQTVGALLSALNASAWNAQTFTTDRTSVAHNTLLSVVVEFDGAGMLGADSMIFCGITHPHNSRGGSMFVGLLTGSWAINLATPVLVLVAADGTIGTLGYSFPATTITAHILDVDTSPDEIANQFVLAHPATIEGVTLSMVMQEGGDFELNLYEGDNATPIESLTVDEDSAPVAALSIHKMLHFDFNTPRDLTAGVVYRVSVKPTTTNNVHVYSIDVNSASYLDLVGGQDMHYWARTDAGAWSTETLTRFLLMKLHFSKTDISSGGGGLRLVGNGGLV